MAEAPAPGGAPRYTRTAIVLHWLLAVALLGQIGFGFALDAIAPRSTPARAPVINLHKSFGLVLFALIALRVMWRLRHPPPAWPSSMSAFEQRAARIGHRALYACMVVMPLSGYVGSNFSKYGVVFFGMPLEPWGPENPSIYAVFNGVHVGTAFVFAALIAGHVAMALKHAWVDRDGVVARIWPGAEPRASPDIR
jgi:cytochrome b561